MRTVAIIPARWQSTRLKGKVLADIAGKPMVQHVWERVSEARGIDEVIVAVDKGKVFRAVTAFGGKAVMTDLRHSSGTDRIAEVARSVPADIFVNVQADEPLIDPLMIDELVNVFEYEHNINMGTLIKRIDTEEEINDPNVVKVVVDRKGFALYFSRAPIPHMDRLEERMDGWPTRKTGNEDEGYFKHIGLYAYTKDFLFTYTNLPKSALEMEEKLEQLRVLEHGYKIKTVETRYDSIGVDSEKDLDEVRSILTKESSPRGISCNE